MDDLATAIPEGRASRGCGRCSTPSSSAAPRELAHKRSGYEQPVLVAVGPAEGALRAVAPAAPALRADPDAVNERTWLLVAALVGALVEVAGAGTRARGRTSAGSSPSTSRATPTTPSSCRSPSRPRSRASTACGRAPLTVPAERARRRRRPARADRRRAPAVVAARVAALGGRPADPASMEEHEDAVLAALDAAASGPSRARTTTPTPPGAWRGASCSAWTAWGSGAATTPSSPTWRAASPATSARWPRRWARPCSPPACWRRSRASASATCSSTRGGPATSTRSSSGERRPPDLQLP